MTAGDNQWLINLVRDRYQYLNVNLEQAKKIYQYEQVRDTFSDKHFFSQWEEWDFEQTTFKEILDDEQFSNYELFLKDRKEQYEQDLMESDRKKINEIFYVQEQLDFYETHFLPPILESHYLKFASWLPSERAKADYLKAEYLYFLNDNKKELLTTHFRYNRTFMPNELNVSLLRHKLTAMFPNYNSFKHKMDEPTKTIAHYLKTRMRQPTDDIEELLIQKFNDLKAFNEANFQKYYGELKYGSVMTIRSKPEEEKENRTMALLLIDKDRYGY